MRLAERPVTRHNTRAYGRIDPNPFLDGRDVMRRSRAPMVLVAGLFLAFLILTVIALGIA